MRFPTGRWDDANNLVDYPTGYGAWGLGLQLHQDVRWSLVPRTPEDHAVRGTGDVVLSTTLRYEALLPDTKAFRVCDVNQPLCPNYDPRVRRDVGDLLEAEVAVSLGLLPGLTLTPQYTYLHKFPDHFRGDRDFPYGKLRNETNVDTHSLDVRLTYSTLPLVAARRFPVPVSVTLLYTDRLASTNNRLKTRYLGGQMAVVF